MEFCETHEKMFGEMSPWFCGWKSFLEISSFVSFVQMIESQTGVNKLIMRDDILGMKFYLKSQCSLTKHH